MYKHIVLIIAIVATFISCSGANDNNNNGSSDDNNPINNSEMYVWANNGQDKVTQEELRLSVEEKDVTNSVWDGEQISIFGAKNETIAFNIILEAPTGNANNVSVRFEELVGPGGYTISGTPADCTERSSTECDEIFNYNSRDIELFYVRYLKIEGVSQVAYDNFDGYDGFFPERFQQTGSDGWLSRPAHDQHFPDIAVPLELHSEFNIAANTSQAIWADIYIPKNAPAGTYQGSVEISEDNNLTISIPVQLEVKNFSLPDDPSGKTMLFISRGPINQRHLGESSIALGHPLYNSSMQVIDRYYQLAHRHKISLIGGESSSPTISTIQNEYQDRLDGDLFTSARGYRGAGEGVGNTVYSIGTYGAWLGTVPDTGPGRYENAANDSSYIHDYLGDPADPNSRCSLINSLFNPTNTEHFFYLIDEPGGEYFHNIRDWISHVRSSDCPNIPVLSTVQYVHAYDEFTAIGDEIDYPTSGIRCAHALTKCVIPAHTTQAACEAAGGTWKDYLAASDECALPEYMDNEPNCIANGGTWIDNNGAGSGTLCDSYREHYIDHPTRKAFAYNGRRPYNGSFVTEDDGVALRVTSWGQFKKKINRWFYWSATDYDNFMYYNRNTESEFYYTRLYSNAITFGRKYEWGNLTNIRTRFEFGVFGDHTANGDGVMIYPGKDEIYPDESYEIMGPIASLRLKLWRRGIQDIDYLTMAAAINETRVNEIVNNMIPSVLWELGSRGQGYLNADATWDSNPDIWEAARKELADIIEGN